MCVTCGEVGFQESNSFNVIIFNRTINLFPSGKSQPDNNGRKILRATRSLPHITNARLNMLSDENRRVDSAAAPRSRNQRINSKLIMEEIFEKAAQLKKQEKTQRFGMATEVACGCCQQYEAAIKKLSPLLLVGRTDQVGKLPYDLSLINLQNQIKQPCLASKRPFAASDTDGWWPFGKKATSSNTGVFKFSSENKSIESHLTGNLKKVLPKKRKATASNEGKSEPKKAKTQAANNKRKREYSSSRAAAKRR